MSLHESPPENMRRYRHPSLASRAAWVSIRLGVMLAFYHILAFIGGDVQSELRSSRLEHSPKNHFIPFTPTAAEFLDRREKTVLRVTDYDKSEERGAETGLDPEQVPRVFRAVTAACWRERYSQDLFPHMDLLVEVDSETP